MSNYTSMELARKINSSTDIVTELTNIVDEKLDTLALQGENADATNTAILDALQNMPSRVIPISEEQIDDLF